MSGEKQISKSRKILEIVLNVLMYLFFAICCFSLIVSVLAKKDSDGAVSIFGKQMRIVISPSMEKCELSYDEIKQYKIKDIPVNSMVFVELVPEGEEAAKAWYAGLKKGDVLTFRYVYSSQVTITHRIDRIEELSNGGRKIYLSGDNKNSDSDTLTQVIDTSLADVSPNYIIGKVTGQSYAVGLLVTAVKSPVGLVCIIIIPCVIIMVMEILRMVGVFTAKKREEEEKRQKARDDELEELKRRLAALQAQEAVVPAVQGAQDSSPEPSQETDVPADEAQKEEPEALAEKVQKKEQDVPAEKVPEEPEK